VLPNLHGEPDLVSALAKLAARRDDLQKEKAELMTEGGGPEAANKFYEVITLNTLQGVQYSADERKEIDTLMRQRDHLLERLAQIETDLATIQKDGVIIKKHCTATPDQIQDAIRAYREKLRDAEALVVGMNYGLQLRFKEAKVELRRLRSV
jgi:hypothetical protein